MDTGSPGCGQWGITTGDTTFWCYVTNPSGCSSSTPSDLYPDATTVKCGPSA